MYWWCNCMSIIHDPYNNVTDMIHHGGPPPLLATNLVFESICFWYWFWLWHPYSYILLPDWLEAFMDLVLFIEASNLNGLSLACTLYSIFTFLWPKRKKKFGQYHDNILQDFLYWYLVPFQVRNQVVMVRYDTDMECKNTLFWCYSGF